MQSKPFVVNQTSSKNTTHNKYHNFVRFYKPAEESNVESSKKQASNNYHNQLSSQLNPTEIPIRQNPKSKIRLQNESIDISTINIDGSSLLQTSGRTSPVHGFTVTSTPKVGVKKRGKRVKSIMKNSPIKDESPSISTDSTSNIKSKKRNKSVSFMLDANEEVVIKKSKSNESLTNQNPELGMNAVDKRHLKKQKLKKRNKAEKENEADFENVKIHGDTSDSNHKSKKSAANKEKVESKESIDVPVFENKVNLPKKKKEKVKKAKSVDDAAVGPKEHEPSTTEDISEQQLNKAKKKKRHAKISPESNDLELESEPATKTRKKHFKPDLETGIENLNIGDNAHTLTDLLDKMTVIDKKKKKFKKKKDQTQQQKKSLSGNDLTNEEKPTEEKEKVKWSKRRWNKDKKHVVKETRLATSVVVENLPLNIMTNYKKLLAEHFDKCGVVQHVGVAELYPSEDPKPVFTTTILFDSENAATQALEEDNSVLWGGRVRVRRALAPARTTLVVRARAALATHALSSAFAGAGRLRSIRHATTGKKSMSTAFIEFDGPEAVERALKLAEDAKIGGKKMYVSKFEVRNTKTQTKDQNTAQSVNGKHNESND